MNDDQSQGYKDNVKLKSPAVRRFAVDGMHCAACAARIEKVVGGMDGVRGVSINLVDEEMRLDFDPSALKQDEVAKRVKDLGFAIRPRDEIRSSRLEYAVGGMHCAACSGRVERVLSALPGVAGAEVSLATETAVVRLGQGASRREVGQAVVVAIEAAGFTAEAVSAQGADMFERREREVAERLAAMKSRLVPAFIFTIPLLILSMGHMMGMPLPSWLAPGTSPTAFALAQLGLTLPVVWSGRRFYVDGFPNLLRGHPNMDSLIAVGTGAALAYSLLNTAEVVTGFDPSRAMDLYYESAAVIIALISLGKYFETRSKARATGAIKELMNLAPDTAVLVVRENGREVHKDVPVAEVEAGDLLLVRPGSRVPVDGEVVRGTSSVDESMLTGESIPVAKEDGDTLAGGTINHSGALVMRAVRVGADTTLARIIRMVREAQGSKAPIASLADRISLYFVPAVMGVALAAGLGWYFAGGEDFAFSLRIFISVMVIACPCAMGLATPTSIMVGTGRGAQLGVLIKSGLALETAHKLDVLIMDKTGTLTRGVPEVTEVALLDADADTGHGLGEDEILALAAGAEAVSEHSLARAVIRAAQERGLEPPEAADFTTLPGRGVRARLDGHEVILGNEELLRESGVRGMDLPGIFETAGGLADRGRTALFMAVDGRATAILGVADQPRPEAAEVVAELKSRGLRLVMVTGDNERTARAVARELGITEVVAQVMPEDKGEIVAEFQSKGLVVGMAGDGINDAPALARADLGIAMGTGIDVAVESGDLVLASGDLRGLLTALRLSRAVVVNIKQNLFWAFAYNVLGIPVASGILYAFGGPTLSPMIAGAAMAMSSVSVVSNSLRLRMFK